MSNRIRRLLIMAALVVATTVYWGCSQPADVLAPFSTSEVTLNPQVLPANFPGMHYELWVANSQDTVSLGRFGYDEFNKRFLEVDGSLRADSNLFTLDDNIFKFSKLFVSIEEDAFPALSSPGPIMLIDDVTLPSDLSVDLVFPLSDILWDATARYNMETTSDSDRVALDGYGIWFSSYQRLFDSIRDTLSLDSFWVDTTYEIFPRDTIIRNLINIFRDSTKCDTCPFISKDTTRIFGVDSFSHAVIRFYQDVQNDTAAAGDSILVTIPNFIYTIGSLFAFNFDDFTQDSFALPDYDSLGWNYKGWVVSPTVAPSAVGSVTLPAWRPNSSNDSLMPGISGGLLTTGTFSKINEPDNNNPYVAGPRLPQFPGEDFIANLPGGMTTGNWGGLVPLSSGNSGTVFISLEPTNFVTDTTNFPLIAFMGNIPSNDSTVTATVVIINMQNRTQTNDPFIGFPRIRVDIKAF
ncbi:MAG: hypothetical protein IIC66_02935 [candidate division Zixibacteria bacterium]|nr:hypothetical protein [candidate division Zixibacteria bacterium]